MTVYHVCVNIVEGLRYSDELITELFRVPEDKVSEVRARLTIAHAQGHVFLPLAEDCDNFHPLHGCGGHESFTLSGVRV